MATNQDTWADVCADGTQVTSLRTIITPAPGVDFGGNFQSLPEDGMFVRAVSAFGHQYAIVKGWADDHAWIIDDTGTQIDLGITYGNYCVAIQATATAVRAVWVTRIGVYRTQSFDSSLVSLGVAVETPILAPSTDTTQGIADLLTDGTPIWTDQRYFLIIKGTNLIRPVFRAGWWIGSSDGNQLPDGVYAVHYLTGRRLTLHTGLVFANHAATSDTGTAVYWAVTALEGTADFGSITELVDASLVDSLETGQVGLPSLEGLYRQPPVDPQTGLMSRSWYLFLVQLVAAIGKPVNLANVTSTLSTDHGGVNPTPSGADVPAPRDAEYIVATANAALTNERVATDTATVSWDFLTAGQAKAHSPSYVPVSTGAEPLVIMSNGAGAVLLTPFTP